MIRASETDSVSRPSPGICSARSATIASRTQLGRMARIGLFYREAVLATQESRRVAEGEDHLAGDADLLVHRSDRAVLIA